MSSILDQDIMYLPGVGPKKKEILSRELGIASYGDLLEYYPYKYVDRTKIFHISELTQDMPFVQIKGKILSYEEFDTGKRNKRLVAHFSDGFADGAVKAQLGVPDMRLPIQYAFSFPQRLHLDGDRLDLFKAQDLQFFEPDYRKFKCLQLAFDAIKKGGNMSCIVNAANEIVNAGFRKGVCGFLQMADIIEQTMQKATFDSNPDLDVYLQTDAEARRIASELMNK